MLKDLNQMLLFYSLLLLPFGFGGTNFRTTNCETTRDLTSMQPIFNNTNTNGLTTFDIRCTYIALLKGNELFQ